MEHTGSASLVTGNEAEEFGQVSPNEVVTGFFLGGAFQCAGSGDKTADIAVEHAEVGVGVGARLQFQRFLVGSLSLCPTLLVVEDDTEIAMTAGATGRQFHNAAEVNFGIGQAAASAVEVSEV